MPPLKRVKIRKTRIKVMEALYINLVGLNNNRVAGAGERIDCGHNGCRYTTDLIINLMSHQADHLSVKVECCNCRAQFTDIELYFGHVANKYRCGQCCNVATSNEAYTMHKQTHDNKVKQWHRCPYCVIVKYLTVDQMTAHIRRVHPEMDDSDEEDDVLIIEGKNNSGDQNDDDDDHPPSAAMAMAN